MKDKSKKKIAVIIVVVGHDMGNMDNVFFKHVQILSRKCICGEFVPVTDGFYGFYTTCRACYQLCAALDHTILDGVSCH